MKRYITSLAVIWLAVAASISQVLPPPPFENIPPEYRNRKGVSMVREPRSDLNPSFEAAFRIINLSSLPIYYYGYSLASPLYRRQEFTDNKWNDIKMGFCGTGIGLARLPPNKSVIISVSSDDLNKNSRVGIDLTDELGNQQNPVRTLWSAR